ncbi:MAG TPA: ABC transporter ATP-binding protein [Bacteroidota bacterium]|nr:ABC transporter ATP-binding protein [Bacteroidota bacterium]
MSKPNDTAIDVRNLVKVYEKRNQPPVRAVDGISFQVKRGEIFGLLGPNGAGKTTTLKILTTLLSPTSGTATLLGYDVQQQPLEVRKNICVVLQENAVEMFLSVRNNFLTFGRFHGLSARETEARMERVLDLFGLREYLHHKAIDLSGGLKRRLQVAKMFVVDKPIVFLDEATTGMDTFNKRATLNAIKEESKRGRTIVLTTHMLEEAEELCNSVAIINHGKIIAAGSIRNVKAMGLRLYNVSLTFTRVSKDTLQRLNRAKPFKLDVSDHTVNISVRKESAALKILETAKRAGTLENFEITSASLEDVFVELIDKQRKSA